MGGDWWQVCVDEVKYQCWGDNRLDTETQASPKSMVVWDFSSSTHFPGAPVWRTQRPKLLPGSCFHHRCEGRPWPKQLRFTTRGGLNVCVMRSSLEYEERPGQRGKTPSWHQQRDSYHLSSPALGKIPQGPENISSPLWQALTRSLFPSQGRVRWLLSLCCDEAQPGLALPAGSLLDLPMLREAHFLLVSSSRKPAEQTGAFSRT